MVGDEPITVPPRRRPIGHKKRGSILARILVIDDNPDVLNTLHEMLTREGHSVEDAPTSSEGLRMHREDPFDLVLTDIVMPDREGISTIIELRGLYPRLKIIAKSGGGDFEPYGYLDIARRVGADRTIPKPFSRTELLEALNDVLSRAGE
jgi:DNA-binding response OmpR family regulator